MEFNVADLIERVAANIPERDAVICGENRASYKKFDDDSKGFAAFLLKRGLGKGDHVGIYGYNSIEWVTAMLGCYKIGAVPININFRYVDEELIYIGRDADLKALVYDVEFSDNVRRIRDQLPLLQHFVSVDWSGEASKYTAVEDSICFYDACKTVLDRAFPPRSGDDHYVLYTGGTTGMPKGVVWRQEDAVMILGGGIDMYTQEPIDSPEKMADRCLAENATPMKSLQMAPLMHGAAQWAILRALFEGSTVILLARKTFDPHEVWQQVEREAVNIIMVTGDAMAKPLMLALEEGKPDGTEYNTSTLFAFASTSAVFSPALKDRYVERLPHVVITDNIGSSESGFTGTTIHEKGKAETDVGGPRVTPARNTVVLDDQLNIIPAGDERIGFLAKSGYIPLAYYKDEEKTAKSFVTAADGKRYVIPGDRARHNADGTITMLGRDSQCINSGGEKIYAEEVEMAVKAHPAVLDCLVVATPHERFGQCVTALIKLQNGDQRPDLASLHKACSTHIARYKLPRRVYYVKTIKRSPSGKADYRWAKEEAQLLYYAELRTENEQPAS